MVWALTFGTGGCGPVENASSLLGRQPSMAGAPAALVESLATAWLRGVSLLFDDAPLATKVKFALASEMGGRAVDIRVETHASIVRLTGHVDSRIVRERANRVALDVHGVVAVLDDLCVRSPFG